MAGNDLPRTLIVLASTSFIHRAMTNGIRQVTSVNEIAPDLSPANIVGSSVDIRHVNFAEQITSISRPGMPNSINSRCNSRTLTGLLDMTCEDENLATRTFEPPRDF